MIDLTFLIQEELVELAQNWPGNMTAEMDCGIQPVILNDNVYTVGTQHRKQGMWKYSMQSESWSHLPVTLPAMSDSMCMHSDHFTLANYQSQPVFIGGYEPVDHSYTGSRKIFVLREDREWKEASFLKSALLPDDSDQILEFVCASSDDSYLIVAWREKQKVKLQCFDGHQWRKGEFEDPLQHGYGRLSITIHQGTIVLTQHCGAGISPIIHKTTFRELFAVSGASGAGKSVWNEIRNNPHMLSNLLVLGGKFVAVVPQANRANNAVLYQLVFYSEPDVKSGGYWNYELPLRRFNSLGVESGSCLFITNLCDGTLLLMGLIDNKMQPTVTRVRFKFLKR